MVDTTSTSTLFCLILQNCRFLSVCWIFFSLLVLISPHAMVDTQLQAIHQQRMEQCNQQKLNGSVCTTNTTIVLL